MLIYVRRTVVADRKGIGLGGFFGILVLAGVVMAALTILAALWWITVPLLIFWGVKKWRKRGRTSSSLSSPSSLSPPVWRGMNTSLLDTLDQESSSRYGSES